MRLGVAYYGSYLPWHLKRDLNDISSIGCDDVLLTLQENDFAVFTGKVRFAAKIAHEAGLKAIANFWGFARMLGGGRMSNLLTESVEWWQVNREGQRIGLGCMNNPKIIEAVNKMIEEVATNEYDGIFIDEPTRSNCFCQYCKEKFRREFGGSLLSATPNELEEFRSKSVIDFLDEVCSYTKSLDPKLETATCVMPRDADLWERTVKITALDNFGTDPYWLLWGKPVSYVAELTDTIVKLCRRNRKKSLMWILCWKIPSGKEEEIYEAMISCAEKRPDAIYAWSYKAGLGTYEESDNPDKAWSTLIRAYRYIKENM